MQKGITDNKQLARNMVFNAISLGLAYAISFFLTPYIIKMVGKEAYGFFPLINNLVGYTSIITAAIGSMAGRFITIAIYEDRLEDADRYFNSAYIVNIGLSVLFTVAGVLLLPFLDNVLSIPAQLTKEVRWLFILAVAILVVSLLTGMFGLSIYVKNRIDLGAIRGIVNSVVRVSGIILLFAFFKPSIVYVSLAALVASVVEMCLNISFKKRFLPEVEIDFRRFFSVRHLRELFSSGVWNSFNCLSDILLRQLDLLITNIFIGALATGDYAIAKTIPTMLLGLMASLTGTFFAQFNIVYAQEGTMSLLWQVKKAMRIIAFICVIPVGFLLVFSNEFLNLWVPGQNNETIFLLSVITLIPMVLNASLYPIGGIFTTTNKLKVPSLVLFASGLFNIGFTFLLLKTTSLGIYAIALSAGIQTFLRDGIFTPIYAASCLGRNAACFFPTILKNMGGVLIVLATGFAFKHFFPVDNWFMLILAFVLVAGISMAFNALVILQESDREYFLERIRKNINI